jgi:hypothetical protein
MVVQRDGTVTMESPPSHAPPIGLRRLAVGVLLAPTAWALAELVGYIIGERSCEPPTNGLHWYGVANPTPVLLLLDLILVAIAALGLWTAYGSLVAIESEPAPSDRLTEVRSGAVRARGRGIAPSFGRARFLAAMGVIGSGIFLLGIVWFAIAPLFLQVCRQAP